jgi:hypothetical protein
VRPTYLRAIPEIVVSFASTNLSLDPFSCTAPAYELLKPVEAERSNLPPAERTCWPAGVPTAAVRMFELPQQGFTSGVSNCTMAPWLDKLPRMGKLVLSGYGKVGHSVTLSVAPTVLLTPGCYQSGDVVLCACCLGAGTAIYTPRLISSEFDAPDKIFRPRRQRPSGNEGRYAHPPSKGRCAVSPACRSTCMKLRLLGAAARAVSRAGCGWRYCEEGDQNDDENSHGRTPAFQTAGSVGRTLSIDEGRHFNIMRAPVQ